MASRKITNAGIAKLDGIGEERVMDMRCEGVSVRRICAALDVTARQLYSWLGWATKRIAIDEDGKSRRDRWIEWSLAGAEHRAAHATERLENLTDLSEGGRMKEGVTREEVALAKALAEEDRRCAGDMDPSRFRLNIHAGGGTPNVNIGTLHLHAVQRVGGGAARGGVLPGRSADEVGEAEVLKVERLSGAVGAPESFEELLD